jgi:hypothetical protein
LIKQPTSGLPCKGSGAIGLFVACLLRDISISF